MLCFKFEGQRCFLPHIINELIRIDGFTLVQNFKMNMGCRRPAGCTHFGDLLSRRNSITGLDQQFIIVGVACDITIAMINFHEFAISILQTGSDNDTTCDSQYFTAPGTGKIQAIMLCSDTGEGIVAFTKP